MQYKRMLMMPMTHNVFSYSLKTGKSFYAIEKLFPGISMQQFDDNQRNAK